MTVLKKVWKIFHSMNTAFALLFLLVIICTLGSLIPQGQPNAYYVANYPAAAANIIIALHMSHTFTTWWFIALASLLCLNLLCCSIFRFPSIWKKYQHAYTLEKRLQLNDASAHMTGSAEDARRVFTKLGIRNVSTTVIDGVNFQYARRRRAGIWGAWLSHVGMLIIIVGFGFGQMYALDTTVYGIPGQTKAVSGTEHEITIDGFEMRLRDDNTVEQYTSWLSVRNTRTGEELSGITSVNAPMEAFGLVLYQNSTGWASTVSAYKEDVLLSQQVICQGEALTLHELPLALYFAAFYPDYFNDGTGPRTLSPRLNNPQYVYALYYDNEMLAMNRIGAEESIRVDSYRFVFEAPAQYTLIQVIHDPALAYAALGGILLLIGIFLAFYVIPEEIWVQTEGDQVTLFCKSVKGSRLFVQRITGIFNETKGETNG